MADHDGKVKRRTTYAVQDLITAVNMIHQKQMGLMQAAREYNIPKSTLQNNLRKNKHGMCIGSPTSLTADQEQDLVDHLIAMQKMGVCLYEDQLKLEVQELMREAKHLDPSRKFRFADDMPGMCVCQKIFQRSMCAKKCVTIVQVHYFCSMSQKVRFQFGRTLSVYMSMHNFVVNVFSSCQKYFTWSLNVNYTYFSGRGWVDQFKKCHPQLAMRTPVHVSAGAAKVTEQQIHGWFTRMERTIQEIPGGGAVLKDPTWIFNCDESSFLLDASTGCMHKVFAAKGSHHVHQRAPRMKEQITVLGCVNAAGDFMPPMFMYPGKHLTRNIADAMRAFPEAFIGLTETGWMKGSVFVTWLAEFDRFVEQLSIEWPVVLFIDGHASHITIDAAQFC